MKNVFKSLAAIEIPLKYAFVICIKAYQYLISPVLFRNCCIFHISCSSYALRALRKYRIEKAILLTTIRIARCNTFLPPKRSTTRNK
ncbi:membrane protein insertion efficiency factor YidD [Candidatus Sneabacter namystus]|uniref:Membrane protein insertion efficiency factor YidD n=1 Tax=Candidatus Sneabacter namystus TaxID=2601646 RepID=A0A5C0UII8_9RICK|nr:membrane protein insertion efficiency factor YidD [Candidatus Sneabacter namystus]